MCGDMLFRDLKQALAWCSHVQLALLEVEWPSEVHEWQMCQEEHDEGGVLIWRGVRVQIGMAYFKPDSRKPLNTGKSKLVKGWGVRVQIGMAYFKPDSRKPLNTGKSNGHPG